MNYIIEKLNASHNDIISDFQCVETSDDLSKVKSDDKRRIKRHSKEMEDFLKKEALEEQDKFLNTTHLFIDPNNNKLIGYISLCADSVRLAFDEKEELEFSYCTIPAIKIARLAVANDYKHKGIGKLIIEFGVSVATEMLDTVGVAFITLDCYKHRVSFYEGIGFIKNQLQDEKRDFDNPISMRLLINDYLENYDNNSD